MNKRIEINDIILNNLKSRHCSMILEPTVFKKAALNTDPNRQMNCVKFDVCAVYCLTKKTVGGLTRTLLDETNKLIAATNKNSQGHDES